jgi:hypothetical protein
MLKRKTATTKPVAGTELQSMHHNNMSYTGNKVELPTNEAWAVEMPTPQTDNQPQVPWSNLNPQTPHSAAPSYVSTASQGWNGGMTELAANSHGQHHELPSPMTPQGQYHELPTPTHPPGSYYELPTR